MTGVVLIAKSIERNPCIIITKYHVYLKKDIECCELSSRKRHVYIHYCLFYPCLTLMICKLLKLTQNEDESLPAKAMPKMMPGPLLLTFINFNSSMDKKSHTKCVKKLLIYSQTSTVEPFMYNIYRDHSVCAPSQWDTTLQCKVTSHWPGTCRKWSLYMHIEGS